MASLAIGSTSGQHGPAELDHLALEVVDPRRAVAAVGGEHLLLDFLDVLLDLEGDRRVVVHDRVGDGVQHSRRAAVEDLRLALEPLPHVGEGPSLPVPDGDHERVADEQHHVAQLDLLRVLVVAHRLQDDEQRVVVLLDLRPLVRLERVLDRQRRAARTRPRPCRARPRSGRAARSRRSSRPGTGRWRAPRRSPRATPPGRRGGRGRSRRSRRHCDPRRVPGRDHCAARAPRTDHRQRRRGAGRLDRGRRPRRHRPGAGDRAGRPAGRRTSCRCGQQPAAAVPGDRGPDARRACTVSSGTSTSGWGRCGTATGREAS